MHSFLVIVTFSSFQQSNRSLLNQFPYLGFRQTETHCHFENQRLVRTDQTVMSLFTA
jgi:hypothetical protein